MTEQPSPESIFERVLQCTGADERTVCLEDACGGNEELRREVESLLAAHEAAGSFLEPLVTPEPATPGEQEGDQIGHYKLLELIGEGGFGRVWMAEQTEPVKRRVALKIVKLGMDTGEVLARFEAERQALALMDHPNIAKVFDGGATDTGRPYFVMELVRGVPITTYCDANKLPPRARIELFEKVCRAVQHAHQKGIIHRDLKPSNILVTVQDDQPVPKVIDFGIAKALQTRLTERTLFTRFNQWVGTPAYMSPEQAGLSSHDVDVRSDVYSLGTILYELLTGNTPFDQTKLREDGYEAMLRTIREEDPPKPSTRLSSLSREALHTVADHRGGSPEKLGRELRGELDWILLKTLERDRSRRYESTNLLADELRRFCADEPISAAPPSFTYQAGKYVRKHRKRLAVAAAAVLLGLAAAWLVILWPDQPRPEPFERTGRPLIGVLLAHEFAVSSMDYSPAHRMLAASYIDGAVELWDADTGELLATLKEHDTSVWSLAFSPDGDTLATASYDGRILLWDVTTRKLKRTFKRDAAPDAPESTRPTNNQIRFSPDGEMLAAALDIGSITLWDLKSGSVRSSLNVRNTKGGGLSVGRLDFAPDGKRLVVAGSWNQIGGWLTMFDVKSGRELWKTRSDPRNVSTVAFSPDGKALATGNADHTVRLLDAEDGRVLAQLPGHHSSWVLSVAFSPDGKTLASGSSGIMLWDVESRTRLTTLVGHHNATGSHQVHHLAFYADGRTLASAGDFREIKIWDVEAAVALTRAVAIIQPLIDPAKLDTLKGERAANRRLRLIMYHLEDARLKRLRPAAIIYQAQRDLHVWSTTRAEAVKSSLIRNLDILRKLGCLDPAGMAKLRKGNAPTITLGPYKGDIASVDHIIPRSVVEELDERLYNLEFMPAKLNSEKGAKVTVRQVQLARKWHAAGLLSEEGLRAVEAAK